MAWEVGMLGHGKLQPVCAFVFGAFILQCGRERGLPRKCKQEEKLV